MMRILLLLLCVSTCCFGQTPADPIYQTVPLKQIKPLGWLKDQLTTMRNGSTGQLDEIYDRLKQDNGWLGGKGDGWEETPYWLDGALPLAYLLDDKALEQKTMKYINWALQNQEANGNFGPISENGQDWWPKMIILKVLQQYYSATGDARVIAFMTKYFHYQLETLGTYNLGHWSEWSRARGQENLHSVCWLYRITKDEQLIKLANLIVEQSYKWSKWFEERELIRNAALYQDDRNVMQRHSVNVAMGLKDPVVNYLRTGDKKYLDIQKTAWEDLMVLHGLPMGIFSGDEDIHGNSLIQGTELCTVVEAMYSLEKILEVTGEVLYMDALERLTFNALPAQTTDDYHCKQYFQLPNQVQVARGALAFSVTQNNGMSNVFGTQSGWTCCYTNMHQGWPKFAAQLWHTWGNNGIATLTYAPSVVQLKVSGATLKITETTNYPFEDRIYFTVESDRPVSFPWQFRIPSWCKSAEIRVNGMLLHKESGGQLITIEREWKNDDKVELLFPMEVAISRWASNSRTVERGPLVYALRITEKWKKSHHEIAGDYYSVYPQSAWNYGLLEELVKNPAQFTVKTKEIPANFIWNQNNTPVEIVAKGKKIPSWKLQDGILHQPVCERGGLYVGNVSKKVEEITLIPYGCSKLRIVAFPVVK